MPIIQRRAAALTAGAFTTLVVAASTLLGGLAAAAEEPTAEPLPAPVAAVAEEAAADPAALPAEPPAQPVEEPVALADAHAVEEPLALAGEADDAGDPDADGDGPTQLVVRATDFGIPVDAEYRIYDLSGQLTEYGGTTATAPGTSPVDPGDYLVMVSAPGYATEYWQDARTPATATPVTVAAGASVEVTIELDRLTKIVGRVENLDGTPAPDYAVHVTDLAGEVLATNVTNDVGVVGFGLVAGQYLIEVRELGGALLGYVGSSTVLSATPVPFGVTDLGAELQFRVVLGAEEPQADPCVDPETREPLCDEEPEHCDGEWDGQEFDCEPETGAECDPLRERCDESDTTECDPLRERCDDSDRPDTSTLPEYPADDPDLPTLALTGAPVTSVALTAGALLLAGLLVSAARRRTDAR